MDNSARQVQNTPPKPRKLIDNAAEVRRRKEAAERLIRERHEALRRQHEEKIQKINEERLRQQRELKERHAKELKRQQDVLQRRMALMERDKARKQEILEKNHAVASRLSTSSSRKNYAFGSSTPRELSFLDSRLLRMNAMEKRSPEKQSPPNGPVNARRGRSMASMLSTSMFASTPSDRARHTASVTRLAQPKSTPTKSQNSIMTQSVYHPPQNATPVSRLRRKPPVSSSVPSTPMTGSTTSTTPKKIQPKPKPRGTAANAVNKKPPTPPEAASSPQRKESIARSEDIPTPLGITASEPPRSEHSFTSDEIPIEMTEKEAHYEAVESPIAEANHHEEAVERNAEGDYQIPSEPEETTRVSEVDVVIEPPTAAMNHMEHASEEEAAVETMTKDVIVADPNADAEEQLISPVPKSSEVDSVPVAEIASPGVQPPKAQEGGASLADELAGVFGGPSPAPLVGLPVEDMHAAPPVEHSAKEVAAEPVKEVPAELPPAEKPVEKPSEVPPIEKPAENPQPAEAPLIDLGESPRKEVPENPPVEKVPENPPVEKVPESTPVEKVPERPQVEKMAENPPTERPTGSPPVEEKPKPEKVSYENPLIDFHKNEGEPVKTTTTNVATTERVHTERVTNHVHTNGIEQQAAPVITADLPGTVPAKEIDESVTRKVPTPPNEFIAHRLRREQEQREIDERKARIAAILAKSRDLSSGTPLVAGRTSPPRGETAQDVLKRLASNGNLPALQKLVARRTPEPPTIDQIAPEDPAPQAI